jgi:hypothetical protein
MGYMKRGGPKWPLYLDEKDDYGMTAECLKHSGRVLVNNYLYPWSRRFEGRGGSPTLEERTPGKQKCVKILMDRFPVLFRIKDRKGRGRLEIHYSDHDILQSILDRLLDK